MHASNRKEKKVGRHDMADCTIRAAPASIFSNKSCHVTSVVASFCICLSFIWKVQTRETQFGDQHRS